MEARTRAQVRESGHHPVTILAVLIPFRLGCEYRLHISPLLLLKFFSSYLLQKYIYKEIGQTHWITRC